ncbi:S-layer homology domain-containing protein [Vallitalea pronyensis]|uniref:S-layer homology domain-containing protein n=1 Tax=Vallitalea pronyensis TaxID=1348613 RepID=A0A8J8MGZ2_9FIRM|nr:S-layer homology domain-containing protein [Vallitalea pronyensis]QUI21366.1 S-layer homology domain-containing protein [Vallitalea pronyensis]
MKKLCAIVLMVTLFMTGCSKLDEYDVGMELLTMELNSPQHWGFNSETSPENYFNRILLNGVYIPSLELWRSQGEFKYPMIHDDDVITEKFLDGLKDVEGLVKRSTVPEITYTPGVTFLKYLKNEDFVSYHYNIPGNGYTAELRFDLPEVIDDILGTDLGVKIVVQRDNIGQYINYDRYSGIYMRYVVALTKSKGYIEKKELAYFKPLADRLADAIIVGKYPNTIARELVIDSVNRDDYVMALQNYLHEQFNSYAEQSYGEVLLLERGLFRFDNNWENPVIYSRRDRETFKNEGTLSTNTFSNYMKDAVQDEATFNCTLTDIDTSWAKDTIIALANRGAINGFPDHTYKPKKKILGYEFVTMFTKVFYGDHQTLNDPKDVRGVEDAVRINYYEWWRPYFVLAGKYIKDDRSYELLQNMKKELKREEVAYMVANQLKLDLQKEPTVIPKDINEADSFYKPYINACMSTGALNGVGDGLFNPKGSVTREQAAQVIYNVLHYQ